MYQALIKYVFRLLYNRKLPFLANYYYALIHFYKYNVLGY
jgi:hypothetical protein